MEMGVGFEKDLLVQLEYLVRGRTLRKKEYWCGKKNNMLRGSDVSNLISAKGAYFFPHQSIFTTKFPYYGLSSQWNKETFAPIIKTKCPGRQNHH